MKHLITFILLMTSTQVWAARIGDVTRLSNQRTNVITGLGLVYGLKGSGDGGDFMPAIRRLAGMLNKFDAGSTSVMELRNAKNVAIVTLTATIPANGARDGDALDVYVTSIGAASTLKGGRLFVTPMIYKGKQAEILTGFANGAVLLEDPSTPVVGVIKDGCVIEGDFPNGTLDSGMFRLIIDEPSASWTMSSNIAKIINDSEDGQTWAWAMNEKEVAVRIPPSEQKSPDGFISRIQRLPVPLVNAEARVQINERTGTVVVTGDVEISPVVISHKGLTISTVTPAPVPSARTPVLQERSVVALDTINTGGAKLQDLINALDQLKVPVQDRIDIIKELHKTGKLHAKLISE
jgi:flagellar P-ring protein FlgI